MFNLKNLATTFQFSDLDIRTAVAENDDVWFCAKDVCSILDITWSGATLENMPENWVGMLKLNTPSAENGRGGGEQNVNFINEAGLYFLIFRSNKPNAKEFASWVCEEVLPQIRKHGFYGTLPPKDYVAVVRQISQLTAQLAASKNVFVRNTLISHLRLLHNMAGTPMPDIQLIAKEIDQTDLFLK
jgi:prophage antirepressor-like protein